MIRQLKAAMTVGDKIIFTGLPEAFFTYLKVSLLAGLMLATPIVLYEFWMFVAPGLYEKEKKLILSFSNDTIQALPSMREYLSLSARLLLAFGLAFELPLMLTFMARLGLVSVSFLKKNRKYAILIFFAGAAILTPPDVVTQVFLALPLMVLYELSIIGARLFGKKPNLNEDEAEVS